jgi:hypothetical protein
LTRLPGRRGLRSSGDGGRRASGRRAGPLPRHPTSPTSAAAPGTSGGGSGTGGGAGPPARSAGSGTAPPRGARSAARAEALSR